MLTRYRYLFVISSLALLAGCASVQVTNLNPAPGGMSPRPASEVEVFLTKAPAQAYDEVFLIRADAANSTEALEAMRAKAGELGCDGLVIAGQADRVVSTSDGSGSTGVSTREGYVGSCIVFSE